MFGDPTKRTGPIFAISGPASTWDGERKTGATDLVGKYDGVFSSKWLVSGQAARHVEKEENFGTGRNIAQSIDATVNPNALSGGFTFFQDQEFTRDNYKADLTTFFGGHSVKGGIDFEHIKAVNQNFNGGAGQRIYKLQTSAGGRSTTATGSTSTIALPATSGAIRRTWVFAVPLVSEPDSKNLAWYVQDSWRVGSSLTINGGIRWEGQDVRSRDNESAFKLTDNWAPRIGFVWDVARNQKSKLYANWGRFFESIPMDINIRAFGGEVQCFCYNFSPDPTNFLQDPAAPRPQSLLGGAEAG